MLILFIVLLVVALGLGGFITFISVRDFKKKKTAAARQKAAQATEKKEQSPTKLAADNSTAQKPASANAAAKGGTYAATKQSSAQSAVAKQPAAQTANARLKPSQNPAYKEVAVTEDENGNTRVVKRAVLNGNERYIVIKYSKSFLAKLIQSDETVKNYYSEIKNCLLSYKGVKSRISWRWETFRLGRKALTKLRLRGKTLSVAFALNPADYEGSKYIVESIEDVNSYAETPCLYRIKNDRRVRYCKELIEKLMTENEVQPALTTEAVDYAAMYPYETLEALLEKKLIKELTDEEASSGTMFKPRGSVSAYEVDEIMRDEQAEMLVQKGNGKSDKTKTGIVNIDTLSQNFADGERVTLEEIKKRIPSVNKKVTYIKVLARGTLDKKLTVEADSFSLQAVKMIVLTGGTAVRK